MKSSALAVMIAAVAISGCGRFGFGLGGAHDAGSGDVDAGAPIDAGDSPPLDAPPLDAPPLDAPPLDADDAPPPDGCVPLPEACNGADDDCDGEVDEGFDFDDGALSCGGCGVVCHTGSACVAGACTPQIASHLNHSCVWHAGVVRCWGWNDQGQLGTGDTNLRASPTVVAGLPVTTMVAVGSAHTCALATDGRAYCWGSNDAGQLGVSGVPSATTPTLVAIGVTLVSIAAGNRFTCAIDDAREVWCWGTNVAGESGRPAGPSSATPMRVAGVSEVLELAVGNVHSCALDSRGRVYCWGDNARGQLGNGGGPGGPTPSRVAVDDVRMISSGYDHACALTARGEVHCWGNNASGQLGNGLAGVSMTPTRMEHPPVAGVPQPLEEVVAIGSMAYGNCASTRGGNFYCLGYATQGEVTGRPDGNSARPVLLSAPSAIAGSAGGFNHNCTVVADGRVYCWGVTTLGAVGNGETSVVTTPTTVPGITTATGVAAGARSTCVIEGPAGEVRCFGSNIYSTLGDGTYDDHATPAPVRRGGGTLSGVTEIEVGEEHAAALTTTGHVVCWGLNSTGECGGGDLGRQLSVADSMFGAGCSELDARFNATCVRDAAGIARCAGNNTSQRFGATAPMATPTAVPGLGTVVAPALGATFFCAVEGGGHVSCLGSNAFGQLGDGTYTDSSTPVRVRTATGELTDVVALELGYFHACAIDLASEVYCWGLNSSGNLGSGSLAPFSRNLAARVLDGSGPIGGVVELSAGHAHTCARTSDSRVLCWGGNEAGQSGGPARAPVRLAREVPGIADARGISAGAQHTCVHRADDTVACWGSDYYGQLGRGSVGWVLGARLIYTP